MKNLEKFWLLIGIILTNATQLRLPSLPIGLGEIMLFFWVILALIKLLINKLCLITPILKLVSLFWIVAFTSLTLGLEIADSMNLQSSEWYRDYFAFGFSFILSICLANSDFLYSQTQKMIDYVISFSMLALFGLIVFKKTDLIIYLYEKFRKILVINRNNLDKCNSTKVAKPSYWSR
ncbi:hypothetical protein [Richelia sinica]|uniref:hypothetical protein n=1 Tax=Richelia sinica TaxID=1357545 RepID=UPI001C2C9812|nr:hypothetical protein [Richelia sinica]